MDQPSSEEMQGINNVQYEHFVITFFRHLLEWNERDGNGIKGNNKKKKKRKKSDQIEVEKQRRHQTSACRSLTYIYDLRYSDYSLIKPKLNPDLRYFPTLMIFLDFVLFFIL